MSKLVELVKEDIETIKREIENLNEREKQIVKAYNENNALREQLKQRLASYEAALVEEGETDVINIKGESSNGSDLNG